MKRIAIALLAVAAVGAISFTGCVQKEALPEPEIPAHYTTYTDEAALFSISYPPDWEPDLSAIAAIEEEVKDLISSIESDLPVERTSVIFIAAGPTETGYPPVMNIIVESLPGVIWKHDTVVEETIRTTKLLVQDYHEFSRVKTTVGGREATIIECEGTFPELGGFHILTMITLVGKTCWNVTCTPPPGEFSDFEDDFHAIVRSLRILK